MMMDQEDISVKNVENDLISSKERKKIKNKLEEEYKNNLSKICPICNEEVKIICPVMGENNELLIMLSCQHYEKIGQFV